MARRLKLIPETELQYLNELKRQKPCERVTKTIHDLYPQEETTESQITPSTEQIPFSDNKLGNHATLWWTFFL